MINAGAMNIILSKRSSMPPWPGSRLDESLTATSRLNQDSTRSPNCPTVPTINPLTSASASDITSKPIHLAKKNTKTARTIRPQLPQYSFWERPVQKDDACQRPSPGSRQKCRIPKRIRTWLIQIYLPDYSVFGKIS
jgi:hypothetical protein